MPVLQIENAELDVVEAYKKASPEFKQACYQAVKKTLQSDQKPERPFGLAKGDFSLSDKFFEPLSEETLDAFEGKT